VTGVQTCALPIWWSWHDSVLANWCQGTLVIVTWLCFGELVSRYSGDLDMTLFWRTGVTVLWWSWHDSVLAKWCQGTLVILSWLSQTRVFSCDITLLSPTVSNVYQILIILLYARNCHTKQLTPTFTNVDTIVGQFPLDISPWGRTFPPLLLEWITRNTDI